MGFDWPPWLTVVINLNKLSSMMDAYREMTHVLNAFARARISYAICGGVALCIHGFERCTTDMDVLILPRNIPAAKKAARAVGFRAERLLSATRRDQESGFRVYRMSKGNDEAKLGLDLIEVSSANWKVWRNRKVYQTRDGNVAAVSSDGLIELNQHGAKPQNLVDIERLITEVDRASLDMSPNAITKRLQTIWSLWRLAMHLKNSKLIGPVETPKRAEAARRKIEREIERFREGPSAATPPNNPQRSGTPASRPRKRRKPAGGA